MLASLIAYAAALGIAAVIPGPGVAALVGQSLGNGLRSALFLLGGIILGDIAYLTVAIAGLAGLAQAFSGVFVIVKILGGAWLVYLAWKLWGSAGGLTGAAASRKSGAIGTFLTGFSLTLGNPKTIVFYLALLPTVLDLGSIGPAHWAALAGVTAATLTITLTPYAVLAHRARRLMSRPSALARLNRAAAGIIGATGAVILGQAASAIARRA